MIKVYQEYKKLTPARKSWYRKALFNRIKDVLGLVLLLLTMCIEI